MGDVRLVVHGHFYQPPRENPWTERSRSEPSAAPFHDWNERITAECYRPNGWARVLDEHGRVSDIVNNYAHLSFNVGPTLLSWLETHRPDVYERILEADREGGGAIAQAYNHTILPLANERDVRTQIRWGLADFEHRFGRRPAGMWLPETAVNDDVLRILVEEGVGFTILAPNQAVAVRALDADDEWADVSDGSITTGPPYRWFHPDGSDRFIELVFYDGPISHDLAFGLTGLSSQELVRRVGDAATDGTPVVRRDRRRDVRPPPQVRRPGAGVRLRVRGAGAGVRVVNAAAARRGSAARTMKSRCARARGRAPTACAGGRTTAAAAPAASPVGTSVAGAAARRARRRCATTGSRCSNDGGGGAARPVGGARRLHRRAPRSTYRSTSSSPSTAGDERDEVATLTLLEAQRHALLMYTSCGWFFNDLAGIETVQVLRYARPPDRPARRDR